MNIWMEKIGMGRLIRIFVNDMSGCVRMIKDTLE